MIWNADWNTSTLASLFLVFQVDAQGNLGKVGGVGFQVVWWCCLLLNSTWGFCPFSYCTIFPCAGWCFIHVGNREVKYENTALAQGVSQLPASFLLPALSKAPLINIVLLFHANHSEQCAPLSLAGLISSVFDWCSIFPCWTQFNSGQDATTKDETFT